MTWWGILSILERDREVRPRSKSLRPGRRTLFRFVKEAKSLKYFWTSERGKEQLCLICVVLYLYWTNCQKNHRNNWPSHASISSDLNWWSYLDDGCGSRWLHFAGRLSNIQQGRPQNEQILWCSKDNTFVIFHRIHGSNIFL